MVYFLELFYNPNTAATNRLLGYYKAVDKAGVEANIVFLFPDVNGSRLNIKFENINVKYYWKYKLSNSSFLRFFRFWINLFRFCFNLKKGDIVYTYDVNKATRVVTYIRGVRVYCEVTEYPAVSAVSGGRITGLNISKKIQTIRRTDGLFVISRPLKDYYVRRGMNPEHIHIINMTVDVSRFDSVMKTSTSDRYIAYCGTVSNSKDGVDELIKAFAIVSDKIQDVKLYIIGNTPDKNDTAGNLKLIEELGVGNKIVFTGIIPASKMPQILKDAEILALDRPDNIQAKHGFPTKLGEYLMTANPVVVTSVGDIPFFLSDGVNALLAEPNNPEQFAQKLIWGLNNKEKAEMIGKEGRQVAVDNFNCYTETKKLLDVMINS